MRNIFRRKQSKSSDDLGLPKGVTPKEAHKLADELEAELTRISEVKRQALLNSVRELRARRNQEK